MVNLEELDQLFRDDPDGRFISGIRDAWPTISAALWAAQDVYTDDDEKFSALIEEIRTPLATNREGHARAKKGVDDLSKSLSQYDDPNDAWMSDTNWGGRSQTITRRQAFEEPSSLFGGKSSVDIWREALAEERRKMRRYARALAELGHPIE